MKENKWNPLDSKKLKEIKDLFFATYPETEYGDLALKISEYWFGRLERGWEEKSEELKELDLAYDPSDPLSRVSQKTTVITYADSISRDGEESLVTLDGFIKRWFPAVGGLHILPACTVAEGRFNDGYFSQVVRDSIHEPFGSNEFFADLVHRYFSMNDLVMGHVDIDNPAFKAYLEGDDEAGRTFYTFKFKEYEALKAAGSFDRVFRPRPFPLFSIFRRVPESVPYNTMPYNVQAGIMRNLIIEETGVVLDSEVIGILYLYEKVRNDQMLLEEDYSILSDFISWLKEGGVDIETIFTLSRTQEVQHIPYIFKDEINSRMKLLEAAGFSTMDSAAGVAIFERDNWRIFGEEIRALTTFSHVQVDVNTTTFEGLKAFCGDLVWYLAKDLNMLRLDAVNYAFKKWGTSCFGLPELDQLMKIVYLSMECISPRMIPNLEVNDSLTTILNQMTAKSAAPPMMHDFHLASLLPAVFHLKDPSILKRIFEKINEFDIPPESIRFSLSESHDGKSVRGSMDLMKFSERRVLTEAVLANKGYVKYKSIPLRESSEADWGKFCGEIGLEKGCAREMFFKPVDSAGNMKLQDEIQSLETVFSTYPELGREGYKADVSFFFTRILSGRDPYELCITTRNSLPELPEGRVELEAERFLAFQTLAFSVMGRNVKTIYFNDLLGLPNDYGRVEKSGELRDIKRTRTDYDEILPLLEDPFSFTSRVATGINTLIGLVDSDPALHFRGEEASVVDLPSGAPVAAILNSCGEDSTITIVNLSEDTLTVSVPLTTDSVLMIDHFTGDEIPVTDGRVSLKLGPFGRMWLKAK
ncbi:MAG: hypothetical protein JEY99_03380 [Spirochaetales bacterium]|nr:hypothetical protein [Spirochaetales bacterium]